ncbi:MAG: bifunctional homocysteine S-methyltransferase/methylenetetrahydrofolate reductase, partial [Chloroflexi bacterium]|nr:bifunctional homocysteine S-methyltransferase/methylenetetrahydrofolate reductase [Chloroflexota bacterium]
TTPQHIAVMKQAILSAPTVQSIHDDHLLQVENEVSIAPDQQPTKLAQKLQDKQFIVAVEMDPPRGLSTHKLLAGASLLAESGADVINVADSPMARMRMSPWAVSSLIQSQVGIETILHFPTRGRNLLRVQGDLLAAHALNVRNVFVVMGDPTAIGDYPEAMDNYDLVPSGLIKLIKQGFNSGVDHSGSDIGQPTTFFVGCALNLNPPDIAKEVKALRRKIEAGSDFILTQPIYEPQKVHDLLQHYQDEYGPLEIPLLIGILPLASVRHAAFLNYEVPGISIPPAIYQRMEQAENGAKTGIQIAIELIQQSKPWVQGVYLMPAFNRFDNVAEIIEAIR